MKQRLDRVHPIRQTHRAVLVGKTGAGKSVLAAELLKSYTYVVVLDTKHNFDMRGNRAFLVEDFKELKRIDNEDPTPILIRPGAGCDDPESLDGIAEWVFRRKNCTYYIDEAYDLCASRYNPFWFRRVMKQGRALNIRCLVSTQRPTWIPLDILSEAEHFFCFRLQLKEDRKRMAELMGEGVLNPPAREHAYYYTNVFDNSLKQYELKL